MPYMLVRIRLDNFSQWKSVWDEAEQRQIREAYGCKASRVFRGSDSPDEAVVLMQWDELDNAKEFGISDELREAMKRSGGAGQPTVLYLNEVT